jgi:predicted dehydrogenase
VKVLLIGNGYMATEYAKVLQGMPSMEFDVAGRNQSKVEAFTKASGAGKGFLFNELNEDELRGYDAVILASSIESLPELLQSLLRRGVKKILVEKPVALSSKVVSALAEEAEKAGAEVRVALNRRFYQSVLGMKRILKKEPIQACFFDFTEWAWQISESKYPSEVKARWALANSIHVIDTVVALTGARKVKDSMIAGHSAIPWHPSGSIFAGMLDADVPIAYLTNWSAPGRWAIEVTTENGRYRFAPMERLTVMRKGTVEFVAVDGIDYAVDQQFKPGLFNLTQSFLKSVDVEGTSLPSLADSIPVISLVERIAGYVGA